jgi:hypothetical protein
LQIEKAASQSKRLKERNSEGVNGLPFRSTSLFFKPSKNLAVHRQKSQASAVDSVVEPVTLTEEATMVAYKEGVCWAIFFDGSADEGFLWIGES